MEKLMQVDIKNLFSSESKKRGVEKYADIMKAFLSVNVATDKAFQRKFNGFYRVRRNEEWQGYYYSIMEQGKISELSFEQILRELYIKTGKVEASFVSKLLHTLNNELPIWDKFVLQNLGLKMPACQGEKKIECAICIYQEIIAWYKKALSISEINQKLLEFDELFPEYKWFSKTKKLDFLLWQMR